MVDAVEQRLAPTMDSTSPSDMQVHSKEHPCQMENSVTAFIHWSRELCYVGGMLVVSQVSAFQCLLELPLSSYRGICTCNMPQ